jgi:hypothetical protein
MADPPRPSLGFKRRPAGIIALAIYALFWACVTGFIGVCFLTLTTTVWPFFNNPIVAAFLAAFPFVHDFYQRTSNEVNVESVILLLFSVALFASTYGLLMLRQWGLILTATILSAAILHTVYLIIVKGGVFWHGLAIGLYLWIMVYLCRRKTRRVFERSQACT